MACKKFRHRLNAYIYGKCVINKNMVTLANNLNTIKCAHLSCSYRGCRKK